LVRIGKTPKKLDSICCPKCRETNADTLKWQRPVGEGNQEVEKRLVREELIKKVTHMHRKAMRVNSLYSYPYLNQQKALFLPIIAYTLSSTKSEIRAK
jgi:hypothetical protein